MQHFIDPNLNLNIISSRLELILVFLGQDNRGDICKNMDQYGHGRGTMHGGFCEFSLVKAKYCYSIQTDITSDQAALLEPMGELSTPFWGPIHEIFF